MRTKWGRSKKSFSLRGKQRRGDILAQQGQADKQAGRQINKALPQSQGIFSLMRIIFFV